MKKIIILLITCCIVFQLALLEGYYTSTAEMEEKERLGGQAQQRANITVHAEEQERKEGLYNPQATEQREIEERRDELINAYATEDREKEERSSGLKEGWSTHTQENIERQDLTENAQVTKPEEQRARIENNASLTERMEKEAHLAPH